MQALSGISESLGDILDVTYNWVTRVLYVSVATIMEERESSSRILKFWRLPIDNPVFDLVYTSKMLSNDSVISTAVAPFAGYVCTHVMYVCVCVCVRVCVTLLCVF